MGFLFFPIWVWDSTWFRPPQLCCKEISPRDTCKNLGIEQKVLFWCLARRVLGSESERNGKCLENCRAIPLKYMPTKRSSL